MRYINTVTPFEKMHFDPTTTTVVTHGLDIEEEIGIALSDAEIIELSGAPTGSTITVSYNVYPPPMSARHEHVPSGLYFTVENPKYIRSQNIIGVFQANPSTYGLYIKYVDLVAGGPKGLAGRMIAVIVRAALSVGGIAGIQLLAAGGRMWDYMDMSTKERWGGYVAWPTYGFDMTMLPITFGLDGEFPFIPEDIKSLHTVLDVLEKPLGREYWKIVGDGSYMTFDLLSTTTRSMLVLDSFLEGTGV